MSQENVEPARLGIELFNRGDVAAFVDQYDPDVVFQTSVDNPDVDTYSGRQAVAALGAAWREMFAELRVEPAEFIDAGDYVIVPARVRGRGATSGAEIDMPRTWTTRYRDRTAVEVWEHRTKEQALTAIGRRE